MHLKSIEINNIRNINFISAEFPNPSVFIYGKNGQGKTSILESIFLLSHARSFRSPSIQDIVNTVSIKTPNSYSQINGIIETGLGNFHLGIRINKGKRELYLNEKKVNTAADFCGKLKTVLFTPEDLELVKGAPLLRRQFLDRILVMLEPSIMNDLSEYAKIIKNRNKLLTEGDFKKAKIFDPLLMEKNYIISKKRLKLFKGISAIVNTLYKNLVPNINEEVALEYKSSFIKDLELLSKEEMGKIFESSFERDTKRGSTNIGIHRDEIILKFTSDFASGLSKIISSQGQIRCVSLCCKLASAKYIEENTGESPLLLLDDIDSELDEERRENLYQLINAYEGQVFITGTRLPNETDDKNRKIYEVLEGKIQ